jgi:hypothetical protein
MKWKRKTAGNKNRRRMEIKRRCSGKATKTEEG